MPLIPVFRSFQLLDLLGPIGVNSTSLSAAENTCSIQFMAATVNILNGRSPEIDPDGPNDKINYNAPVQNSPFFIVSFKKDTETTRFFFNASDIKSFLQTQKNGIRYRQWHPYIQALTFPAIIDLDQNFRI